jgi:hypothetical protein
MRAFGALIKYAPDAMAAFEKRKLAAAQADGRERSQADKKCQYDDWYKRGRAALEALTAEKRQALEADVRAKFAARWPRSPERGESQFFKRMVERAMISEIIGAGPGSSNPSPGQVQLS